jgi:glycolate oxidase iron-sulfur subunit
MAEIGRQDFREPLEDRVAAAGAYNILQPDIAAAQRDRKVANIARVKPEVIAAGNIGCIAQIASPSPTPVLHAVELLDYASGGPAPPALA